MESKSARYGRYLPTVKTVVDCIVINLIFTALVLLHQNLGDINFYGSLRISWVCLNTAFFPVALYFRFIHRQRTMKIESLVVNSIKGIVLFILADAALTWFLAVESIPGYFFTQLYVSALILFPLMWIAEYYLIRAYRRRGKNRLNAIIVGVDETALRVFKNLRSQDAYGISIIGFIGDKNPGNLPAPYLGSIERLEEVIAETGTTALYFAGYTAEDNGNRSLRKVINVADNYMCAFYYVPPMSHFIKRNFFLSSINGSLPALGLHPTPLVNPFNRVAKRSFDILFSSVVLACSPLVLIPVAIAIKASSPGPVFFRQKRTGYRGKDFDCWKFRTMKVNSAADSKQATKDDDRKTRVGNFLRHTSIDELPQFWNVLKGDMSVVGPRPHMLSHTEEYRRLINQYMVRHLIKPGITGWAQIQGFRGATDELWQMEKRVDSDVWYIEHWSFMLDLKIIVKTVTNAVSGEENAY